MTQIIPIENLDWRDITPDGNWGSWYYTQNGHKIIMSYRSLSCDPEDESGTSDAPRLIGDKHPRTA